MNPISAFLTCMRKYVKFTGRASRSEFWWFIFDVEIIMIPVAICAEAWVVDSPMFREDPSLLKAVPGIVKALCMSINLLIFGLPKLAVTIRRLHDLNQSGWWSLLLLIPLLGWLYLIIRFCCPGTAGTNRFGDDPLRITAVRV